MTVYVTQSPQRRDKETGELVTMYDLTPAREYGDIEVLMPSGPVKLVPADAVATLRRRLSNFTSQDYLVALGDPVVIAAAAAIVAEHNDGVIPLLVWDRHIRKYLSIQIDVYGGRYE